MWWSAVVEVQSLSRMRKCVIFFFWLSRLEAAGEGVWRVRVSFILSFYPFLLETKRFTIHQMSFNINKNL